MSETIETIQATLIPWEAREGIWGVAIDLRNGQRPIARWALKRPRRANANGLLPASRRYSDLGLE